MKKMIVALAFAATAPCFGMDTKKNIITNGGCYKTSKNVPISEDNKTNELLERLAAGQNRQAEAIERQNELLKLIAVSQGVEICMAIREFDSLDYNLYPLYYEPSCEKLWLRYHKETIEKLANNS